MTDGVDTENESLFEAPPVGEQERMVEAILFASADPVTVADMNARMPHGADAAQAVELLRKRYEGRGVQVVNLIAFSTGSCSSLSSSERSDPSST